MNHTTYSTAAPAEQPKLVYLAGPMTGIRDLNFPAFHAGAARLRAQGYIVINPAELCPDQTMPWTACMRRDIAELVKCESIALLPGWTRSRGALLEHHIAQRLGMERILLDGAEPPTVNA